MNRAEAERAAGRSVRGCLGNRCRVGSVGGAPVNSAVFAFVKTVLGVDIANTYGTRECGGISMDGVVCEWC
jgi:long-subunit acyl-CoA synthetase (AMP-forming)